MNPSQSPPPVVAVAADPDTLYPQAATLARHLALPLTHAGDTVPALLLTLTPQRLELRSTAPGREKPIFVDWLHGSLGYRSRHGGAERLARAVGLGRGGRPSVLDATAGLGSDGFILAHLGYPVTLVERNPVVAALLRDGIERAMNHPGLADGMGQRLRLITGDAVAVMALAESPTDVVYLDPMFPHPQRKSAQKKEMRRLALLLGPEDDAPRLLTAALNFARNRVVVKRPDDAPPLSGPSPSLVMAGNSIRFDIYLI